MDDNFMKKAVDIISKMPPPEPPKIDENLTKEKCLCGHLQHIDNLMPLNTGVFTIISDVCKNCKCGLAEAKKSCFIVCARCKRVIKHLKPHKCPRTGFEFKPGKCYHVAECGLCNPKADAAPIIEKTLYTKHQTKK